MSSDIYFYGDLPEVLDDDEQRRLLEASINGSDDAKGNLQIHNLRIIIYVINKYFNNTQYEKRDLFSIGCMGLRKAINTYDLNKNIKFLTYAYRCVFNEIANFCRDNNKYYKVDSLDRVLFSNRNGKIKLSDTICDKKDIASEIERKEINRIIREIVNNLSERDRKIIEMSFGFNGKIYKQEDISKILLVSQSYVSNILIAALFRIKEKLIEEEIIEREPQKEVIVNDISDKIFVRKRKIRSDAYKSIYEHFKEYSKEQIDEVISELSEREKEIISYKYGNDYVSPTYIILKKSVKNSFFRLLKKMKYMLYNKENNIINNGNGVDNEIIVK